MTSTVLRLTTGFNACFSAHHLAMEVEEDAGKYFVRIKQANDSPGALEDIEFQQVQQVSEETISSLLETIKRIIEQPEQGSEGRSTTKYYAVIDAFGHGNWSPLSVSSSAMPREALLDFAANPRANAASRKKAEALLANGYHVWAHELYAILSSFVQASGAK